VATCERLGVRSVAVKADVALEKDVLRLFATVDAQLGRLDALVNNAGVVSPLGRVADYTLERITTVVGVNLVGALLCAREAVRRMSTTSGGQGASSSTCRRWQPSEERPVSMSTTPPPRARWTP